MKIYETYRKIIEDIRPMERIMKRRWKNVERMETLKCGWKELRKEGGNTWKEWKEWPWQEVV